MKLKEVLEFLADKIDGVEVGDGFCDDFEILGIESPKLAESGYITFLEKDKYIIDIQNTNASMIIAREIHKEILPKNRIVVISKNPYLIMAYLTKLFAKPLFSSTISPSISISAVIKNNVTIGNGSKIGDNTLIMSGVVIGENVEIGDNCIIYPNVCIYNDTKICSSVAIHANSVIGGDGFGYAHTASGEHIKIYHNGVVIIEDDVEIGSNVSVDRAVFGETRIKKGVKIDNLVQIAHNCVLGEYSIIVSQVGLSGSTSTGRNVVLGGQAGSVGHLHIGEFSQIGAKSGITKDVKPFSKMAGYPLLPLQDWLKTHAITRKLLKSK